MWHDIDQTTMLSYYHISTTVTIIAITTIITIMVRVKPGDTGNGKPESALKPGQPSKHHNLERNHVSCTVYCAIKVLKRISNFSNARM